MYIFVKIDLSGRGRGEGGLSDQHPDPGRINADQYLVPFGTGG